MEKSIQFNFRLTPVLRDAAQAAADRSGLSLADWIRAVVARAAHEGAFAPKERRGNGPNPKTARKSRATGG